MSALEFLINGRRNITLAHFDHGTSHSQEAADFILKAGESLGLQVIIDCLKEEPPKGKSKEAHWHDERYQFFKKFSSPVILVHHLLDAVEWWLFTSLRGKPRLMPIINPESNVIRPFLLSKRDALHRFSRYDHIEDPSNADLSFARNIIRHELMSTVKKINPGIETTVRNLYNV